MPAFIRQALCLLSITLVLSACGGGNSAGPPAAPTLSLDYGLKLLKFSWNAVAGASYYKLSENPDGLSGYTQIGSNLTTTSYDHYITLYKRLNASYLLEACNNTGCTSSSPVYLSSNLVQAIGYVKASNTEANDSFGANLAFAADGNTLAIGAGGEASNATGINGNQADNSDPGAGAVYIFTRNQGVWSQQAYVKTSNTDAQDGFGSAVALSSDGNTLAIGAAGEASNATGIDGNQSDNSLPGAGAVYVFTRTDGAWSQQAYIKASYTDATYHQYHFGDALSFSGDGNTLAIGADGEASASTGVDGNQIDNSAPRAGAVYLFTRASGKWSQDAYIKASNTASNDFFGYSLALAADGNTLAVGAFAEESNATGIDGDQVDKSAPNSGAVYVFVHSNGLWSQQAYVKASNTDGADFFSARLALAADGDTLAVGATGEASNATGIGGNQDDNSALSAGAVYVYIRTDGKWSQQAYIKASNSLPYNYFGSSIALDADGNALAVGAAQEASNAIGIGGNQAGNLAFSAPDAGAVYVYTRTDGVWLQQAYVKASNTDIGDQFGSALSLSADGTSLAVGAPYEASDATGIGGNQVDNSVSGAGAAYLY